MLMRINQLPTLSGERNRVVPRTLSSWLDEVFDDAFKWTEGAFVPEMNVYETESTFEITFELPGMNRENIDISLDENVLTVSGERKSHHEEGENGYRFHRVESRYGSFSRSLPLPNIVDRENVNATYDNGVLAISIPKLKEKAGRKIEIS